MKGIILAGGKGTRLFPLTSVISKQLLPVYDKPMIYYPLSTLIEIGISEILIISSIEHINLYKNQIGPGDGWGVEIEYKIQQEPNGIAEAIIIGEEFIGNDSFVLILGDNLIYHKNLNEELKSMLDIQGAGILGIRVDEPSNYGVAIIENEKIISLHEKPKKYLSDIAIPGIYFYDNRAVKYVKKLNFSSRGELEITDLNKLYLREDNLTIKILDEDVKWFDLGTFEGLFRATQFVREKLLINGERVVAFDIKS